MFLPVIPAPLCATAKDGRFPLPPAGRLLSRVKKVRDKTVEGEEAYRLTVMPDGITLAASTDCGLFRGFQTLKQLVATARDGSLPCLEIVDRPRFAYRAFMLDSVRHMQTVDEIKRLIDAAALFKLNVMHWHLSDDQGFRIESRRFPALNTVGSFRDGDTFEKTPICLPYGGYYTREQIREVVRYCASKYIEVIPEIDMPGHVCAMLAAYPHLSCREEPIAVRTRGGIFDDLLCAGKESTYTFVFSLLEETMELFPSEFFHIGGDEAPKGNWYACPHCAARMRELGLTDAEALQAAFTRRVADFLREKGKKPVVWNDSLKSGSLDISTTVQYWLGDKKSAAAFVNDGGTAIDSDFYHYYADYPFGMTPLWKTYLHEPSLPGVRAENRSRVKGPETPIWTEYVRDEQCLHYRCFPRFAACAESGWTERKNKSYPSFRRRMCALLALLKEMGISAAPPSDWDLLPLRSLADIIGFFSRSTPASAAGMAENKKKEKENRRKFLESN